MRIGSFRKLPLHFRWGEGESRIGLVMGGDADGTVRMVGAIIMVMERLPQKGKEQETDENE